MKAIDKRTNKGYEVQFYDNDGNNGMVMHCDTIEELAQYLARCCWGNNLADWKTETCRRSGKTAKSGATANTQSLENRARPKGRAFACSLRRSHGQPAPRLPSTGPSCGRSAASAGPCRGRVIYWPAAGTRLPGAEPRRLKPSAGVRPQPERCEAPLT